jgi:hypothetical protein
MIEFIVPLYNLLQHFTNHYLRLDTLDLWLSTELNWTQVKVEVTLRLTVGQSVSQSVLVSCPIWGSWPDIYLFDRYGLVFVGRPLWREDGSVFYELNWTGFPVIHYSLGADSTENTSTAWQWMSSIVAYSMERVYLATSSLPRISLRGNVFIEPLPSNVSVRHSINERKQCPLFIRLPGNYNLVLLVQ